MKIKIYSSSSTIRSSKSKKTATKNTQTAFTSMIGSAANTNESTGTSSPGNISSIDSILALQTINDEERERQSANHFAKDMLEDLATIQRSLLTGRFSLFQLEKIERKLKTQRPPIEDPKLTRLLNEIELRVRVEVAKLKKYK